MAYLIGTILALISVVIALYPHVLLLFEPASVIIEEPQGDLYFYLVYARNMMQGAFYNWNGVFPSNGFHPLWALLITPSTGFFEDLAAQIRAIRVIEMILFTTGCLILFKVFRLSYKSVSGVWAGVAAIVVFCANSVSLLTGMEDTLAICLLAATCLAALHTVPTNPRSYIIFGLAAALTALARLDLVIVMSPLALLVLWRALDFSEPNRKSKQNNKTNFAALVLAPIVLLGFYVSVNLYVTGHPVPVSGSAKSTFPMLQPQIGRALQKAQTALEICGVILALVIVSAFFPKLTDTQRSMRYLIALLLTGFLLLVAYHVLFTYGTEIGGWYFSYVTLIFALAVGNLAGIFLSFIWSRGPRSMQVASSLIVAFGVLYYINDIGDVADAKLRRQAIALDNPRPSVVRDVITSLEPGTLKNAVVFDGTDGYFGLFSGMPSIHAKGLTGQRDYIPYRKRLAETTRTSDFDQAIQIYGDFFKQAGVTHVISHKRWSASHFPSECLERQEFIARADTMRYGKPQVVYAMTAQAWITMIKDCKINEFGLVWDDALENW